MLLFIIELLVAKIAKILFSNDIILLVLLLIGVFILIFEGDDIVKLVIKDGSIEFKKILSQLGPVKLIFPLIFEFNEFWWFNPNKLLKFIVFIFGFNMVGYSFKNNPISYVSIKVFSVLIVWFEYLLIIFLISNLNSLEEKLTLIEFGWSYPIIGK